MKRYIYLLKDGESIFYVGQTKNAKKRLGHHVSISKLLRNEKDAIIRDIIKAGRRPILEIIQECNIEDANKLETETIRKFINDGQPLVNSVIQRAMREKYSSERRLSKREIDVLQLLAEDLTTEEISEELSKSQRTIETIRQDIKNKLQCRTIPGVIVAGIKKGYIQL